MVNINFVPDDYLQNSESRRTNIFYIVLLSLLLLTVFGSFMTIRLRQRSLDEKEAVIDNELAKKKEQIKIVEQLQRQRNSMWTTALTTVELLEPVSKSVVLASLTNNLPAGVSLLRINLVQKEPQPASLQSKPASDSSQKAQGSAGGTAEQTSREKLLETLIEIEGTAPSDIEVAAYIEKLSKSILFTDVALVESQQMTNKNTQDLPEDNYRQFKLTAMLRKDVHLTEKDVEKVSLSAGVQDSAFNF